MNFVETRTSGVLVPIKKYCKGVSLMLKCAVTLQGVKRQRVMTALALVHHLRFTGSGKTTCSLDR